MPGDAGRIIDPALDTMPRLFQRAGYHTGIVGKWHLGLSDGSCPIDWNQEINLTPIDLGFDESFMFPATTDRVPCVYVEGRSVVNLDPEDPIEVSYESECPFDDIPTYHKNPELLEMESSNGHDMSIVGGIGRIGYMRGGKKAIWRDEDLAETFLGRALQFINESRKEDKPFFLYYAVHQPHVPRVPSARFCGATALGPRGDVIAELDWCVGQLMEELEKLNIRDNTMIIFSSDNGPVLDDGYVDGAFELNGTHRAAGPLRRGNWAYLSPSEGLPFIGSVQIETGLSMDPQLYNMDYDIGQRANVAWDYEDVVKDMEQRLQEIMKSDRTRE